LRVSTTSLEKSLTFRNSTVSLRIRILSQRRKLRKRSQRQKRSKKKLLCHRRFIDWHILEFLSRLQLKTLLSQRLLIASSASFLSSLETL